MKNFYIVTAAAAAMSFAAQAQDVVYLTNGSVLKGEAVLQSMKAEVQTAERTYVLKNQDIQRLSSPEKPLDQLHIEAKIDRSRELGRDVLILKGGSVIVGKVSARNGKGDIDIMVEESDGLKDQKNYHYPDSVIDKAFLAKSTERRLERQRQLEAERKAAFAATAARQQQASSKPHADRVPHADRPRYGGMLEAGAGICVFTGRVDKSTDKYLNRFELGMVHGAQINQIFFVGAGFMLNVLYKIDKQGSPWRDADGNTQKVAAPIFGDIKVNFKRGTSPFFDCRMGGVVGAWRGLYAAPGFGVKIPIRGTKHAAIDLGLGAEIVSEKVYKDGLFVKRNGAVKLNSERYNNVALQVKLGIEF